MPTETNIGGLTEFPYSACSPLYRTHLHFHTYSDQFNITFISILRYIINGQL